MVNFNAEHDLPAGSLAGKVYFITGGNAGLGLESIIALARAGAKCYLGARSTEKANDAIEQIRSRIPTADVHHIPLDLTSLPSIKSAAQNFQSQESKLDGLLNNAGIMMTPYSTTSFGVEIQLGTNYVGHFALTQLLIPQLRAAPEGGRVVNVSSVGHNAAFRGIPQLKPDEAREKYLENAPTFERYGVSKLANIYHAKELARREGIMAVAVHPGVIFTNLYTPFSKDNRILTAGVALAKKLWWTGEEAGAKNQLWALTTKKENLVEGGYYVPVGTLGNRWWDYASASRYVEDKEAAGKLWEWAEEIVGKAGF